MEYDIQFSRLSTTEKLPDRFLNAQIKNSTDLSKSSMGQVFWVIEILTPWFPTAQIGQTIINTFSQSYYEGGSTSDLANFEQALKKVNETLAQITQNGETDWIGNLNGILGVLVENKMHIAQTGKCEAYIFRDGKINHLTYGLATNNIEAHPLKTFSNITSGELKSHDKVLLSSPDIYKHLSIDSLQQVISMNTPNEAVLQTAKILKKKKVSTVNALVMNLLDMDELAKQPPSENNTVFLDRPLESIWAGGKRFWNQLIFPVLKIVGKSSKKASKKSLTFTKNYLRSMQEKKKTAAATPPKKKDLFEKEFIDNNPSEDLLKDEEIQYSPELEVHYYNEKKKIEEQSKISKFFGFISQKLSKFFQFIINIATNKKTRPYFFVIVAIILLVIIGLVVNSKRGDGTANMNLANSQAVLRDAENLQKDAKTADLSNDKEKAKQLYSQAIEKLKSIQDLPIVGGNAKEDLALCYTELDKLTATTRFSSLSPLFSIGSPIKSVFVVNGKAFMATQDTIFQSLLSGGKPEEAASAPRNNGDLQFGTLMGKDIFLYTSAQKIYDFVTTSESIDLALGPSNWETANAASNFAGNIYLLDGIIGQIYKHPSSSGSFAVGEEYINTSSIDLKGSVSITVDGEIYVLRSNGEALKFAKGKQQDFSLQDVPTPASKIEKPLKIYTDGDMPSIFVLDGGLKRILEFGKDGHFIRQHALPESFNEISDFFVSYKSKKIWIANGKDLFEISI